LNIFLLVAVGLLFYLFFRQKANPETVKSVGKNDSVPKLGFTIPKNLAGARVLYVNVDSVSEKYKAIKELANQTEANLKSLEARYKTKRTDFEQRYVDLQRKVEQGLISTNDQEKETAELKVLNDEIIDMEAQVTSLQNSGLNRLALINEDISKYFKEYSKTKGVDFIMGYGGQSNAVLYANDSLDVTNDVVRALNETYLQSKSKNKKK
jgi:outer membrane protein